MQKMSGQAAPHTPPRGFARRIMAADLRMSEAAPPRAAAMKSAGEQSAGQAS
jgi:hypothetical protein